MRAVLANAFWLIVPALALDLALTGALSAPLQPAAFWENIPSWVAIPENVLRSAVIFLPLLMPLGTETRQRRAGLVLYGIGLTAYVAAWIALIAAPASAWSTSAIGFAAPAWTPALWLTGIALVGDRLYFRRVPYRWWMYLALAAGFVVFHVTHTAIVYARL